MNCPHCNIPLMMADRMGIEIDFCSQCRGVWLDKGELDKIIDLTLGQHTGARQQASRAQHHMDYDTRKAGHYSQHGKGYHKPYYGYKKKKSLLGEIFDIF